MFVNDAFCRDSLLQFTIKIAIILKAESDQLSLLPNQLSLNISDQEMRFLYGKKSRNRLPGHSLSHHP